MTAADMKYSFFSQVQLDNLSGAAECEALQCHEICGGETSAFQDFGVILLPSLQYRLANQIMLRATNSECMKQCHYTTLTHTCVPPLATPAISVYQRMNYTNSKTQSSS